MILHSKGARGQTSARRCRVSTRKGDGWLQLAQPSLPSPGLAPTQAENEALKTQIHRLSGTRIPRKVAPLTAIELSDLLASPQTRAGGSEAEAARPYVKAGAGDGGVSGAGFPGFV